MGYMFLDCNSLISLDLSSFNTQKVYSMPYVFSNCNSLVSIDISSNFPKDFPMRFLIVIH